MSLLPATSHANPTLPFWISKVTAGNGIQILGTQDEPVIENVGILTATAGSGITITPGLNPTITNDGILSVTSGTGITVSSGQNPSVTNDGVLGVVAGTSISIGGVSAQTPIINNPDFFKRVFLFTQPAVTRNVVGEIVVPGTTTTFTLIPNTTYLHTLSYNNSTLGQTPGTTNYSIISRILPQGAIFPALVSNAIISGNNTWSAGNVTTFTTTSASTYYFELRINLTAAGTVNLRDVQTKIFQIS
jgi:hypothetical protein